MPFSINYNKHNTFSNTVFKRFLKYAEKFNMLRGAVDNRSVKGTPFHKGVIETSTDKINFEIGIDTNGATFHFDFYAPKRGDYKMFKGLKYNIPAFDSEDWFVCGFDITKVNFVGGQIFFDLDCSVKSKKNKWESSDSIAQTVSIFYEGKYEEFTPDMLKVSNVKTKYPKNIVPVFFVNEDISQFAVVQNRMKTLQVYDKERSAFSYLYMCLLDSIEVDSITFGLSPKGKSYIEDMLYSVYENH